MLNSSTQGALRLNSEPLPAEIHSKPLATTTPSEPCFICGGSSWWWRQPSSLGGPGGFLCSICHPDPNNRPGGTSEIPKLEVGVITPQGERGCCQVCGIPYIGHRLEEHHILSRSQGRKLRLTKEQLDDARNLITLCFKCHRLTYQRKRWCKDPQLLEKLDKLEQAKRQIGFYLWFEEIKMTVSPGRQQLLLPPELYGFYFLSKKKIYNPTL
ncbi:hypothetical protein ES703_47102 [subsurface metagenome]